MFSILKNTNFNTSLIFWLSYTLFEGLFMGAHYSDFERSFLTILVHLPLIIIASTYHLNFTIRKYYFNKKIGLTAISFIIGILVFGISRRLITYNLIYPLYYPDGLKSPLIYWPKIFYEATQIHMVVSLFIAFILLKDNMEQLNLANTYKQQKIEAELKLLQSQVSPHFLFNTLNNLIALSIQKPNQLPQLLSQLGGLLHYQLEDSSKKEVKLKNELIYIENYIALEKIRYGSRLDIKTSYSDIHEDMKIAPLLLLPLVENAFKHGASQTESLAWIQIRISIIGNLIDFRVENSIPEIKNTNPSTGIGLKNLRSRLKILYPERFELTTLEEDSQFLAILKLNL